jgi:hypothetical protein
VAVGVVPPVGLDGASSELLPQADKLKTMQAKIKGFINEISGN